MFVDDQRGWCVWAGSEECVGDEDITGSPCALYLKNQLYIVEQRLVLPISLMLPRIVYSSGSLHTVRKSRAAY